MTEKWFYDCASTHGLVKASLKEHVNAERFQKDSVTIFKGKESIFELLKAEVSGYNRIRITSIDRQSETLFIVVHFLVWTAKGTKIK